MSEIAQAAAVTLACSDPRKLAEFYQQATAAEVIYDSDESVYLALPNGYRLGFDRAAGFTAPPWVADTQPQIRIDLGVADLAVAEQQLLELGATRPGHQLDTESWIFLADPAGHPFCLTSVY